MSKKMDKCRQWQAVNREQVEKAIAGQRFIHKSACGCGIALYTFRKPGESLEGRLRTCENHDRADRAECAHLHYVTDSGQEKAVAIRLSKILFDAIDKETADKPRLWGRIVRITYKGSEPTKFGHAKKIYLVEHDRAGGLEKVALHETKKRRARKPKPIRRPAG